MGHQSTQRRRRLKIWHGIVVLLLLLFVLFRITGNYKLKKRIQALRSQGYPVTPAELESLYSIPDGATNAADLYLNAFLSYVKWDNDALTTVPFVSKTSLPARTEPLDDSTRKLVEKFLSDNKKTLSLLHEAASIEHCQYPTNLAQQPTDFSQRTAPTTLWLKDLRTSAQLLCLESLYQSESGEFGKALESIQASLALAKSIKPFFLFHRLIQIAIQGLTYNNVERILNRTQLTDEQLTAISKLIKASDINEGYRQALIGEQCFGLHTFRAPIAQSSNQLGPENGLQRLVLAFWKMLGLHDRDAVEHIDIMQDYIDAVELPNHERLAVFDSITKDVHNGKRGSFFIRLLMPAFGRVIKIETRCLAHLRATQTALVVERYRLAEGRLPQSLDNLVPAYMEAVPTDPFDGRSLRYRRLETGFVVYSVGEDLGDNGGAERGSRKRGPNGKPLPWDVTFIMER